MISRSLRLIQAVCAFNPDLNSIDMLLTNGEDINQRDSFGRTALMWAAEGNRLEIARFLLDNGAAIDLKDNNGNTALIIIASLEKRIDMARLLLTKEKEASIINLKNNDGSTALYIASWKGNLEMIRLLLANKAEINQQNNWGYTPLMTATYCGDERVINELLTAGAAIDLQDRWGHSALDKALDKIISYPKIVDALKKHTKDRTREVEKIFSSHSFFTPFKPLTQLINEYAGLTIPEKGPLDKKLTCK